jgi:hypothetical protein
MVVVLEEVTAWDTGVAWVTGEVGEEWDSASEAPPRPGPMWESVEGDFRVAGLMERTGARLTDMGRLPARFPTLLLLMDGGLMGLRRPGGDLMVLLIPRRRKPDF